jgi:acetyl esterase/lipase
VTRQLLLATLLCMSTQTTMAAPDNIMIAADLANFANPPADARIHYGDGELQFGDLRLPKGAGPHPVAVFIHGGCWLAEYDITHSSKLTAALAAAGIATWSLEYRRVGNEGGGWPGTFDDIGRGTDHLSSIAAEYDLDLDRVIVMGHSAGGHLALWLAERALRSADAPASYPYRGVLALAPAADLAYLHGGEVCGHVIDQLIGGSPQQVPERYRQADPMQFELQDVPQVLVIGAFDDTWAPPGLSYYRAASGRGENVRKIDASESGHFEMIDPDSSTWPLVLDAARELLNSP